MSLLQETLERVVCPWVVFTRPALQFGENWKWHFLSGDAELPKLCVYEIQT